MTQVSEPWVWNGAEAPEQTPPIEMPGPVRVDPQALKGATPDYTPEEVAEVLSYLNPLRIYLDGRWLTIPITLQRLRDSWQLYVEETQDRADLQWRSSGAFQRMLDADIAAQREAAMDKVYDRAQDNKRENAANRRMRELMDHGLDYRSARAQAATEFPEQ